MNLLSSLLKYTADQIAALRAKNTSQDDTVSGINTRLGTAETKVTNMEAQLATAISAVTVDSEVQNIRVGDDNVTYTSAGVAVRTQFANVKTAFSDITNSLYKMKYVRDVTNGTTNWAKYVGNIYLCVFVPANVECSFLSQRITYYTMLDSDDFTVGTAIDYSDGYSSFVQVQANSLNGIASANTDRYLTIMTHDGTYNRTPVNIIVNGINILESVIDTFVDIDNALKTIDDTVTLSTTGADSVIKKYEFKSGKKYLAVNSSSPSVSINLRTRATPSGSNIEDIATTLVGGSTAVFTCSQNAEYVYMYANGASQVSIIDMSAIQYRLQSIEAQDKKIVISASGNGDYTTLRAGISEAIKYSNAKVFVDDGTYDLCTEFATEISASSTAQYGICLENDVHIVFSSGAKVKALYSGNDSNVETYFAPFYVGVNGGGFTLENLDIEASNTRYCVHEEYNGADLSVHCKYINCRMSMDNSTAPLGYYPQCIGGGVAKHTYTEILNCYFKSSYAVSHDNTPLVSYHNTSFTNEALSEIFVSNSYFADKGTYRCTWHGTSPDMSRSLVNNCSFGSAPYCQANGSSSTTINMELVEFNNVVRS